MIRLAFPGMGTTIEIGIHVADPSQDEPAKAAIQSARETMVALESVLSRFIPDNDIDRLNRSAGQYVRVSPATCRILQRAEQAFRDSEGLFNPFMGAIMDSIGYRQSFHRIDKAQYRLDEPLGKRSPSLTASALLWSPEDNSAVTLAPGVKLDLGGIAKGWIVGQAAEKVEAAGFSNFVINAGGDMVCHGCFGERPWQISIEHPFHADKPAVTLQLQSLALATSGTYRRRWQLDGHDVHHIVDPRTHNSAQTDVISCSIIHADLVEAEWMAKKALLLGMDGASAWLNDELTQGANGANATKATKGYVLIHHEGEVAIGGLD